MIKQIMHDPNFLSKKAVLATKMDASVITDLRDTLKANEANCVGMAANMIGVNKRIIVCQMGAMAIPLVNPIITKKIGAFTTEEGCLSLSGERSTKRYKTIEVSYRDQNFVAHKQEFSGFIAQIIQHEVDHCEGVLI
ncbi:MULTISPECIES: peptide deformylase [Loigolactobacillus]|uniref:peptide deformylase n=1 Tax=Loigolactobacillus TaxID=2767889 RepID=UPI000F7ECAEE|nr:MULTISPECIES: peptide deformylase [Loigolactobacillus]MDA5388999.1 peptide deformylase [Loigolactobacillus backii]MDA5391523.1 peptide deformylase [Loigolactobacillus backii]